MVSVRVPSNLEQYTNGIDFAIFNIYSKNITINDIDDKLTKTIKIKVSDKNLNMLNDLSKELKKTKSEIIRGCLFWLSQQNNYPTNFNN